jgi:hypothetical protein
MEFSFMSRAAASLPVMFREHFILEYFEKADCTMIWAIMDRIRVGTTKTR